MRRVCAALLAPVLAATGLAVTAEPASRANAERSGWAAGQDAGPKPLPWNGSSFAAQAIHSKPGRKGEGRFPEAGTWKVKLRGKGEPATADRLPVAVSASADPVAGEELDIRVYDRGVAKRVGASGFVFSVGGGGPTPAQLTIDYSGFAEAFGGDYAQRVRVRALPSCVVKDPLPQDCDVRGKRLEAVKNADTGKLTVEVADLSKADSGVFVVTAGLGGDTGTFAATPLSMASSWQVTPGSGEFTYSYPFDLPDPAGGKAPTVEIGYSSGVIDALTNATNMQSSSEVGLGWSTFANAFIERRYQPCFGDGLQDLCWVNDNATVSLGGISGTLIPDAGFVNWHLQSDPGWRFQRVDGAAYTDTYGAKYWIVTAPDGTEYRFGYGHGPGIFTDSILGVQVFADPGEPCSDMNKVGNLPGFCKQAWRWYLDRVIDPDGMVTIYDYTKEKNFYSGANGAYAPFNLDYERSAHLNQIIYGAENGDWNDQEVSARVVFETQYRCLYLDTRCNTAPPRSEVNWLFPDVPLDLVCTEPLGNCGVHAPSFFSGVHYTAVQTEVRKGNTWKPVARTTLSKVFASPDNQWPQKLILTDVQRFGIALGGWSAYPATHFDYGYLQNRIGVDPNSKAAMRNMRLTRVVNPLGGATEVIYGQPKPCDGSYNLPDIDWDSNKRDCFRQQIVGDDHIPRRGIFNKWLVGMIREIPGNGSPEMWNGYIYEGDPGWAFDPMAFGRIEDSWGYSSWRGYLTTVVTKGNEAEVRNYGGSARTRIRIFRGMNPHRYLQDAGSGRLAASGIEPVSVQSLDEIGRRTFGDDAHLMGRTLQEQQLGGASFTPVKSTLFEYVQRPTMVRNPDYAEIATWVGVSRVIERDYSSSTVFKERANKTDYTTPPLGAPPQPMTLTEEGWLGVTGDERCTITSYANNAAKWMWVYPAKIEVAKANCSAQAERLSVEEFYYDGDAGAAPGAAPSKGNPTRHRTKIDANRWSQTLTAFDSMGRVVKVTDPNGRETATTYENNIPNEDPETANAPKVAVPVKITTTNPLGHKTVAYFYPELGSPRTVFDVNGNPTTYTYDSFGNLTGVRLATEHGSGDELSWQFSYDIANKAVRTRRLTSIAAQGGGVTFSDSWVVYDGFWRERQAQTQSPVAGKVIVSETTYDERGQVRDELVAQAFQANPGTYLGLTGWANRTRHAYDALGRETETQWWRGNTPVPSTTMSHGIDIVTTTGPTGRVATAKVDGLGRTIEVAEKDGATWAKNSMAYDLADRLTEVTDAEGNKTTFSYLMTGWKLAHNDPDRGGAILSYDLAGNNISTLTSGNNTVATKFDALNRPTERRSGSATGPLLASWTYDSAPGGKGMLHKETTHTASGAWASEVTSYDGRGRPNGAKVTVPSSIAGLFGSYTTTQTYDRADQLRTVSYPQIGGLPAETVTMSYTSLGQPLTMSGLDKYVTGIGYDDRGRAGWTASGPSGWMVKSVSFNQDQKPEVMQTTISVGGSPQVVARHQIGYGFDGNVTNRTIMLGADSWRECYGYDARGRLIDAYTLTSTGTCGPSAPRGTGPQPYNHSYSYSPAGNLKQRTENGVVTGYTYPAAGAAQPHAPRQVGSDTYQWDARGNLTSRTVGSVSESFTWDVQGTLASAGNTSFVHDPSGRRLLRKTPTGATLYVAGHEVTASGGTVTAVRSYTFAGQLVATRKGSAAPEYLVSDQAGSLSMAVPSGATGPGATRRYDPYGKVRNGTGVLATDRGFIGQVQDSSTKLSYLNARYYDAGIGVFVSPDPVMAAGQPKALNPYAYGDGNPATFSDPGGLHAGPSWAQYFHLLGENIGLRIQNAVLRLVIAGLRGRIEMLQSVIQMQKSTINGLQSRIRTLESVIRKQDNIIRSLEQKIRKLVDINRRQQKIISELHAKMQKFKQIIDKQAHIIKTQQGIIAKLSAKLGGNRPPGGGSGGSGSSGSGASTGSAPQGILTFLAGASQYCGRSQCNATMTVTEVHSDWEQNPDWEFSGSVKGVDLSAAKDTYFRWIEVSLNVNGQTLTGNVIVARERSCILSLCDNPVPKSWDASVGSTSSCVLMPAAEDTVWQGIGCADG